MNLTTVQSLRPRLLASALEVLEERGFDGLSMRAVADRADVTAPALYWHFADKEALVRELGREVARLFKEQMLAAVEAPNSEARLRRTLSVLGGFAIAHPTYFHMLFVRPPALASSRRDVRDGGAWATILQLLVERVAECMHDGSFAMGDAESVALTLAAMTQGLVMLPRRGRLASEAAFAEFFELSVGRVIAGLRRS